METEPNEVDRLLMAAIGRGGGGASLMHPYTKLEQARLRFWTSFLLGAWAFLTPILVWAAPGRSDFTIPDLAVAGSAAAAQEILSHWMPTDRLAFAFILGFDFLYDLVHNNAVAVAVAWAAATRSPGWVAAASILAWLLWLATAANVVENLAFFHMLQAGPSFPWPEVGLTTTYFRNGTLLAGIAFALSVGPGRNLFFAIARKSNGPGRETPPLGAEAMSTTDGIHFEPFEPHHLEGVADLARALGWPSYADSRAARAAFAAPGSITWLAISKGQVIGLSHILSNGVVHAHLSLVGVLPAHRRRGVAKRLIVGAFAQSGAKWLDLWAEPESEGFYRSFQHQEHVGFRIYPRRPAA